MRPSTRSRITRGPPRDTRWSQGAAQLEDDHGAFLTQVIGLYQRPGDTDAEGGEASPAYLQGGEQLEARTNQEVVGSSVGARVARVHEGPESQSVQEKRQ